MDYEKEYNKMLDAARYWHDVSEGDIPAVLEEIFPELRESDDEKIRKALIELFKVENFNRYITLNGIDVDDVIAWLEKQGTSYTKRDVDDAYVEGMAFAKDELEKQKPTWTEEDEVRLQACIDTLQAKSIMGKVDTIQTNWLKSLKQRYTWKPTSAQMKALDSAIDEFDGYQESGSLVSLKKDLEKLKGE